MVILMSACPRSSCTAFKLTPYICDFLTNPYNTIVAYHTEGWICPKGFFFS